MAGTCGRHWLQTDWTGDKESDDPEARGGRLPTQDRGAPRSCASSSFC